MDDVLTPGYQVDKEVLLESASFVDASTVRASRHRAD